MRTTGYRIGYESINVLLPTSNIVERLLTIFGLVLSHRSTGITYEHFEQQTFLCLNSEYWDPTYINEILVLSDC